MSQYVDFKRCLLSAFLKDSRLDAVEICTGNEFHTLGPTDFSLMYSYRMMDPCSPY